MDKEMKDFFETQNRLLGQLVQKTGGMIDKAADSGETAGRLHGQGGVFSTSGLDRNIITAMVRPYGIGGVLPFIPTLSEDPRFGAITGYTDDEGAEPDEVCDDAPVGFLKACNLTARFGLLRRDSNTIDIARVKRKINRGDFTDLILRGKLLGDDNLAPSSLNANQVLDSMVMSEMVNVGVRTERQLNTRYWQGAIGSGQMPGLDNQIATGQKDADSGTLCASLDSDVKDFAYDAVGGSGRSIVEYLSMAFRYVQYNAETMDLNPVKWKFFMRPDLWWQLTEIWPCEYNTNQCASSILGSSSRVVIDGRENVRERDDFRASMTLPVNGQMVEVVTDTGIFQHTNITNGNLNAGQFASSIYIVPITITGGFPVTYIEYLDYNSAAPEISLLHNTQNFWTDAGKYMWAVEQEKWCIKFALRTEQRIVLRTPHLAARVDHVMYEPLQMLRDPDPDSPYHADGGVSLRGHTFGQAVWA